MRSVCERKSVDTVRARPGEPVADPFGERPLAVLTAHACILGGDFRFECAAPALLRIVEAAYGRLPEHRLSRRAPRFVVRLALHSGRPDALADEAPRVTALAGAGLLAGAVGNASFVSINLQRRAALIAISRDLLRFPYHLRYELLEFAVYTLAARAQRLMPLHAGCVGQEGCGILLVGGSGSGKSTLTLHCLLAGLELLAEDSVMVQPASLLATGVANFLHLRRDALRFVKRTRVAAQIRRSPLIRRRSGVTKLEIDLRRLQGRLAPAPLTLRAVVFVSSRRAGKHALLRPMQVAELVQGLSASQRYAAAQPNWSEFIAQVQRLPAYELRRGGHPREAAAVLQGLLHTLGGRAPQLNASSSRSESDRPSGAATASHKPRGRAPRAASAMASAVPAPR